MSTDTALALGVLGLLAPQGTRLRLRLLTVAVVDDVVALTVIAIVYSESISLLPLALALVFFLMLVALRYLHASWRRQAAVVLGVALWVALYESGIDPLVAGLARASGRARSRARPRSCSTSRRTSTPRATTSAVQRRHR
jgi:Na+/H+ antiporter NhaA